MKSNRQKFTIRITKDIHDILEGMKFQHGTLENALNIVFSEWKGYKDASKQIIKNRNSSDKN